MKYKFRCHDIYISYRQYIYYKKQKDYNQLECPVPD